MSASRGMSGRIVWVLAAAAVSLGLAVLADGWATRVTLVVVGLALIGLTLEVRGMAAADQRRDSPLASQLLLLVCEDAAPCCSTDELAQVRFPKAPPLAGGPLRALRVAGGGLPRRLGLAQGGEGRVQSVVLGHRRARDPRG